MGLRYINEADTFGQGADKSNFNDDWLRQLLQGAVRSGYEEEFAVPTDPWVVRHNLNTEIFTYLCVDTGDYQIVPFKLHIDDENQITLWWDAIPGNNPTTGKIKVMFGFEGWLYPGQSEIGLPDDGSWDDGLTPSTPGHPLRIIPEDTIATAVDKVSMSGIMLPPSTWAGLQSAYNVLPDGNIIDVQISRPIRFKAPSYGSYDILSIEQYGPGGVPLTIYQDQASADYSIEFTGATRWVGTQNGDLLISTDTSGNLKLYSADNIVERMGDNAGANKVSFENNSGVEVAHIDSLGRIYGTYVQSTGHIKAVGYIDTDYMNFDPIPAELISYLPKIYVNSVTDHLHYVDSVGNDYDLIDAALSEFKVDEVFIVTGPLSYIDLSYAPVEKSEFVFLNGICLTKHDPPSTYDYSVGAGGDPANRLRFDPAVILNVGAIIRVKYSIDASSGNWEDEIFIVDLAIQTAGAVTLLDTPVVNSDFIFLNGMSLTRGATYDYTIAGTTVTFDPSVILNIGAKIQVKYVLP